MQPDLAHLNDRVVIHVTGEDAATFLQNVMTNDIRKAEDGRIVYSCLLTPQGQFLHEFFVSAAPDGGYFVDCDLGRSEDFMRRINIFKLRSKISLAPAEGFQVYAAASGQEGLADPRHESLGRRIYTRNNLSAQPLSAYEDFCISLGIPATKAMKPEKDYLVDINLDQLNAVAWDKGCFIGQEVTARIKYKGLAKKRLAIVDSNALAAEIGEIRQVNERASQLLAVIKLTVLTGENPIKSIIRLPLYLPQ
jgi:folate-binding protein YgfZ